MNTFDIIFIVILSIALWQGYTKGLIIELCGIIGVILGIFIAYNFSDFIFSELNITSPVSKIGGYILIVIAILILIGLIARAISKLLDFSGLGVINKLLGAITSAIKYTIITSMFLMVFNSINNKYNWVEDSTINDSKAYTPILTVSNTVFPYLTNFTSFISTTVNLLQQNIEKSNLEELDIDKFINNKDSIKTEKI